ncbi:MAG: hypothetical protein U0840_10050 [Gemmataceae bacterium]
MVQILNDLLTDWQEAPDRSPEELCRDHPELLPQLQQYIATLQRIEQLALGKEGPVPAPSSLLDD